MARHHSPYATPHQASPRWPWAVATLLLTLLGVAAALLVRGDILTAGGLGQTDQAAAPTASPAGAAFAVVAATTVPLAPTAVPTAPPAATTAPPTDGPVDPTTVASPAPSAPPPATPTPSGPSPVEIVMLWGERWAAGDYDGLYDLLSEDSQGVISREDFTGRYQGIAGAAGLTSVAVEVTGEATLDSTVPVAVTLESDLVGTITEENEVQLAKDPEGWAVTWTPGLIFRDLGGDGCVQFDAEPAKRGAILTRDGEVLAIDGDVFQISIVPGEIEDEDALLGELSGLLEMTEDEIREAYADAEPEWDVPLTLVSEERGQELLDPLGTLGGVRMRPTVRRVYPEGSLTAHVTGYVSQANADDIEADPSIAEGSFVGRSGLEFGANEMLTGTAGGRLAVVECESRSERNLIAERKPRPAKDVVLTIDLDLQRATDAAVGDVEGDERGSAVVLDPRTGAVLAMVSHPTYDPNDFILGFTRKEWDRVNDEETTPLINRATNSSYPTGSIFKMITTAAAMEYLGYSEDTVIECPAQFFLEGNVYNDWVIEYESPQQGPLTLHQALVQSCNTVFYQIGQDLDDRDDMALPEMARAFGLGGPTGIPLYPEVGGTVPDPEWKLDSQGDYWSTGDAVNLAIGQGYVQSTPLQMANAYATIANGGTLLQPYIVDRLRSTGGSMEQVGERVELGTLPLSSTQVGEIQSALRDQTSNAGGLGSARVFGPTYDYPIAGKTGTAQISSERDSKPHSWFAAFGPYGEDATIATTVMIEQIGEGGSFAAPATRAIYDAYRETELADETAPR